MHSFKLPELHLAKLVCYQLSFDAELVGFLHITSLR